MVLLLASMLGCGTGADGTAKQADDADASDGDGAATGCPTGDMVIESDADAAALAGCNRIYGNVTIEGTNMAAVELPDIHTIDGALMVVNNMSLETLTLASISWAQEIRIENSPALTTISLPNLAAVWEISIVNNDALTELSLPSLVKVEHVFRVSENAILSTPSFPALTCLGDLMEIENNPVVRSCEIWVRMLPVIDVDRSSCPEGAGVVWGAGLHLGGNDEAPCN